MFIPSSRGQASIEFILVLVFMLVVVAAIVVPLGQNMQATLQDVSLVGSVSSAVIRIENDMNTLLGVQSDSIILRDIFLPKGTQITCDPVADEISFTFALNRDVFRLDGTVPPSCVDNPAGTVPAMVCTRTIGVPASAGLTCQGEPIESFSIETGAAAFSQVFRLGVKYNTSPSSIVLDFNAG